MPHLVKRYPRFANWAYLQNTDLLGKENVPIICGILPSFSRHTLLTLSWRSPRGCSVLRLGWVLLTPLWAEMALLSCFSSWVWSEHAVGCPQGPLHKRTHHHTHCFTLSHSNYLCHSLCKKKKTTTHASTIDTDCLFCPISVNL